MDQVKIGETVAKLMDVLPDEVGDDGEVADVMVVVVVDGGDRGDYVRVACSSDLFHVKLGLLHAGIDLLTQSESDGD